MSTWPPPWTGWSRWVAWTPTWRHWASTRTCATGCRTGDALARHAVRRVASWAAQVFELLPRDVVAACLGVAPGSGPGYPCAFGRPGAATWGRPQTAVELRALCAVRLFGVHATKVMTGGVTKRGATPGGQPVTARAPAWRSSPLPRRSDHQHPHRGVGGGDVHDVGEAQAAALRAGSIRMPSPSSPAHPPGRPRRSRRRLVATASAPPSSTRYAPR